MVETIAIRNPKIIEMVAGAVRAGQGRNMVEAAENLIIGGAQQAAATSPVITVGVIPRSTDAHPSPSISGDTRGGASARSAS